MFADNTEVLLNFLIACLSKRKMFTIYTKCVLDMLEEKKQTKDKPHVITT